MKVCSQAVANEIITLAEQNNTDLSTLKMLKLVYIVHGFSLALLNRGILNNNYDQIEAWKFGPVIPSLYHEFKHFGSEPIKDFKSIYIDYDSEDSKTAILADKDIKEVTELVWKIFGNFSARDLVSLLHMNGTPWQKIYQRGENKSIPDSLTKEFYDVFANKVVRKNDRG